MEIIYLLILISVPLMILIATVFIWAVRSGQFDDLEKPRHQILMDDDSIDKSGVPNHKDDQSGPV